MGKKITLSSTEGNGSRYVENHISTPQKERRHREEDTNEETHNVTQTIKCSGRLQQRYGTYLTGQEDQEDGED